jgi:hypothetical protein
VRGTQRGSRSQVDSTHSARTLSNKTLASTSEAHRLGRGFLCLSPWQAVSFVASRQLFVVFARDHPTQKRVTIQDGQLGEEAPSITSCQDPTTCVQKPRAVGRKHESYRG